MIQDRPLKRAAILSTPFLERLDMRPAILLTTAVLALIAIARPTQAGPVDARASGVVTPIRQPGDMLCWITAGTIVYNWKHQASHDIAHVAAAAGEPFKMMHAQNKPLPDGDVAAFAKALGMKTEPLVCYGVAGFADLLKANGPLWVWYKPKPGATSLLRHIVVAYAVVGDGTVTGTKVTYADPADGQEHTDTYKAFMERYESAAWETTVVQIAHY